MLATTTNIFKTMSQRLYKYTNVMQVSKLMSHDTLKIKTTFSF